MADRSHNKTDKKLEEMERHLSAIYSRAQKEIDETADAYFKRFAVQDAKKRKLLAAGKLDEKAYKRWRIAKMATGKHYTAMKEDIADKLFHVNQIATAYVNGELPEVYSLNYNSLADAVNGVGGYSFTLVDAETVRNLAVSDETLLPYKYVDGQRDVRWNTKKVNAEVMQGVLQGDSMQKIAKRMQNVTDMNRTSAIRNARTTVTSAENKGRQDSYERAEKDGIMLKREWVSTNDGRTRHAHILLNGQIAEVEKPFHSELGDIMYPGDPYARPANVYNCRCTMVASVEGFRKAKE